MTAAQGVVALANGADHIVPGSMGDRSLTFRRSGARTPRGAGAPGPSSSGVNGENIPPSFADQ